MRLKTALSIASLVALIGFFAHPTHGQEKSNPPAFWYRARQIVVTYKGSKVRRSTRSKQRAEVLAGRIVALARRDEQPFAELAQQTSEGPLAKQGGLLAVALRLQNLQPEVARAFSKLAPGQVSEPLDHPSGLLILRREPLTEYAVQQLVISWQGCARATPRVQRDEKKALTLAKELLGKARMGEDFAKLAQDHSDGACRELDGHLGIVAPGLVPEELTTALEATKIGAVHAELVKTSFGLHILKRLPREIALARHILIDFDRAFQSSSQRSKDQALALAKTLLAKARANPSQFARLAADHSVDRRLSLGPIPRYGPQAPAPIQKALFKVEAGQVSPELAETRFGFHILIRDQ